MGFTLRISNAPAGATNWGAHFYSEEEGRFIRPPPGQTMDETWDCPYNPYGATDLHIVILDVPHGLTLLTVFNLGPVSDGQDYEFNCSTRELTVVVVEPPPTVTLSFIGSIWSFVWDIGDWFLAGYREVSGWVWPFYYLQYPLYGLYAVVRSLLTPISHFWLWAEDLATKIVQIFSLEQITAYFRTWIDYATDAMDWVRNSLGNVWYIVETWWSSAKDVVQAWIDTATEGFNTLRVLWDVFWKVTWPTWTATLEVLGSRIDDFFTNTLPGLFNVEYAAIWWTAKLLDVVGLIDSSFVERKGFWEGWQDMKAKVFEFFEDPLEFLLTLFTDWFLGPEE